jgi:integrase
VSRRLGHGSPTVTMSIYAHLFDRGDEAAAKAMDIAMGIDGA